MASIIEAKAVISAEDRASKVFDGLAKKVDAVAKGMKKAVDFGPQARSVDKMAGALDGATKSADALRRAGVAKEVEKAARAVKQAADIVPFRGFSDEFRREVRAMKLPMGELRGVVREYQRMQAEQAKALSFIANPRIRQQVMDKDHDSIIGRLRARITARQAERRLVQDLSGHDTPSLLPHRKGAAGGPGEPGGGLPPAIGSLRAIGSLALGYGAQRAAGYSAKRGADEAREGARDYLAGLTPQEEGRLRMSAYATSRRYPSVEGTTMHERLRDTAMSTGSVEKAIQLSDTIGRMMVVLQSLKGKDAALEEGRRFFSALDNLGKNVEPEQVKKLAHGYLKALGVEGAEMNMGDLLTMARVAKSGGASLSDRFLMTAAPALMQDLGAPRLGTALGSSVSQVIGGRATKESKAHQQSLGLRDRKGSFLDAKKIMSDPDLYAWENLIPALRRKKVNVDDNTAVAAEMSKTFSNQVVADLFTKLITQREQYQRKDTQYQKAPGDSAADKLPQADPYVAAAGAVGQLNNTLTILAEKGAPGASAALNAISEFVGRFNESLKKDPNKTLQSTADIGSAIIGPATWGLNFLQKLLTGNIQLPAIPSLPKPPPPPDPATLPRRGAGSGAFARALRADRDEVYGPAGSLPDPSGKPQGQDATLGYDGRKGFQAVPPTAVPPGTLNRIATAVLNAALEGARTAPSTSTTEPSNTLPDHAPFPPRRPKISPRTAGAYDEAPRTVGGPAPGRDPYAPLPGSQGGAGGGGPSGPIRAEVAGPVTAQLSGSADVTGQAALTVTVTASSALLAAEASMKSAIALAGKLTAGGTSMPHAAPPLAGPK